MGTRGLCLPLRGQRFTARSFILSPRRGEGAKEISRGRAETDRALLLHELGGPYVRQAGNGGKIKHENDPFRNACGRISCGCVVFPGSRSGGRRGISSNGIGGDDNDKQNGEWYGVAIRGDTPDRSVPAGGDGDGDLRPGLILGSGLPVRESPRRSPHPCRVHGGIGGEPHIPQPGEPHRDGRSGFRSVRDLLRAIARCLLGKP